MANIGARVMSRLLLAVVFLPACQTAKSYDQHPLTVAIPSGVTPEAVGEAMIQTFEARKWTIVEASPRRTVGTLKHRGYEANAVLETDGDQIKILSDAQYVNPGTGKRTRVVPRGWLVNLQKELEVRLGGKAARAGGVHRRPSAGQVGQDQERPAAPVKCSSNDECPGVMICYEGACRSR
jgi:hypothetical protein